MKASRSATTVPRTKSSGEAVVSLSPSRARVASTISSRDGHPGGALHVRSNGAARAVAAHDVQSSHAPAAIAGLQVRWGAPPSNAKASRNSTR